MFKLLSDNNRRALLDLYPLLVAIYCAAVLGDYVSEALVIRYLGVDVLPQLFSLNAFLLFLATSILFRFVDRVDRWNLIWTISIATAALAAIGGILLLSGVKSASVLLYGLAYIGKLAMFVVFWIIANDICDTRKSKAVFPALAGVGLIGGLLTTIIAGKLVKFINAENLIWCWSAVLLLPILFIKNIKEKYGFRLHAPNPDTLRPLSMDIKEILSDRPVLVMASVYFLVFVLIFNIDFIFAKVLSGRFEAGGVFDAENFLGAKFNLYLLITLMVVVFQFSATSNLSRRFGVTGSILVLPIAFMLGFLSLGFLGYKSGISAEGALFAAVVTFYVMRHFLFECLFSSNYQIFFSAFSRKMRGKGKLILEGVVKPLGIAFAGFLILLLKDSSFYTPVLVAASALLFLLIVALKKEWSRILLREEVDTGSDNIRKLVKKEIGGKYKDKLLALMSQAIDSNDYDLKRVAIQYLEYSASDAAFELLRKKFYEEGDRIREIIANSLSTFESIEARGFLRTLMDDKNPAIRAGALRSIRKNGVIRPKGYNFVTLVHDSSPLVFEEAVYIVYKELSLDECTFVHAKIDSFLSSDKVDEQVAALKLIGRLKIRLFEERALSYINSASRDVWRSAIQAVAAFGSDASIRKLVKFIDGDVERPREYAVVSALGTTGFDHIPLIQELFLGAKTKRMAFSLISIMRLVSVRSLKEKGHPLKILDEVRERLIEMANREMGRIYTDAYRYYALRLSMPVLHKEIDLLRDAIQNRRRRFSRFILEMLSLVESGGALLHIDNFRRLEDREKANIVELIEAFGEKGVAKYLVPILEGVPERELLKIGSSKWKYEAVSSREAIVYFKEMDNKWVYYISLYLERKAGKIAA
jgi:hypothetical protein